MLDPVRRNIQARDISENFSNFDFMSVFREFLTGNNTNYNGIDASFPITF